MGNKMVLKEVVTWMTFSKIISQAVPRKGFIDILASDSGDVGQSDSFCQLADFLYYFLLDFVKLWHCQLELCWEWQEKLVGWS